jgi:hypothetical protein
MIIRQVSTLAFCFHDLDFLTFPDVRDCYVVKRGLGKGLIDKRRIINVPPHPHPLPPKGAEGII